jgi:predicted exporter
VKTPARLLGKSLPWLLAAALMASYVVSHLQLSFDLSAFFPRQSSLSHEILLEQFKSGPGSRLLVIGLSGAERDDLADLSDQLRTRLAGHPEFLNVANGEFDLMDARVPSPIDRYYLLMADIDYGQESLAKALRERLRELALGGGTNFLELVAKDPWLVTFRLLARLAPTSADGDMWFSADGSAVLMAETRVDAVDLTGQAAAIEIVKSEFSELSAGSAVRLDVTGVGAFGVELQGIIRSEAKKRSILASLALMLVLLVVYRSPRMIVLATFPLGLGFLSGLTVLTLAFEQVHGITLAFGFTLLGIAIDYPLHLFSHARQTEPVEAARYIWPTLRLGAVSTAAAYLVLSLSGSAGLAQLGVFSFAGVLVAALATRFWLPEMIGHRPDLSRQTTLAAAPVLTIWPSILALMAAIGLTAWNWDKSFWDDNIASLSPVPVERLNKDAMLRSAMGTPNMRYQLVLHAASLEALLEESENLDRFLQEAVDDGVISDWQSVTRLLPSQSVQRARQQAIPERAILADRLSAAIAGTPFRSDAFEPFLANAETARTLHPLQPEDFKLTPLGAWLGAHLLRIDDRWVALVSINGMKIDELGARVAAREGNLQLVDLQLSSRDLMRDYRHSAARSFGLACLLIVGLLIVGRRHISGLAWILATVTSALVMTVALVLVTHGQLTVIHLVALLLVLGLGLDYALFLGRQEGGKDRYATRQAVTACAASTTLAFGILAASSIPLLRFLGLTVAMGSAISFMLAYAGSTARSSASRSET